MDNKEQAFTQMVREHKSTIYSVCYMFSKDTDEIDDLFQEILIRLWKGYDSFRAESDVRTWIYRVALNCCLNADKKRRRGGERVPLSVILLWLEGLSYEEIGAIMGITVKNVSFQLHRIKEELKKSHL